MEAYEREYESFKHFKLKAGSDESYYLSIMSKGKIKTVNLSKYNEEIIMFGSDNDNDIIIDSDSLEGSQGYLKKTEHGIQIVNTGKFVGMYGNGDKAYSDLYLSGGSGVRFVNRNMPQSEGVVFVMSIEKGMDEWKEYVLHQGENTIGSSGECDIILPPKGVAMRHATITKKGEELSIFNDYSVNSVNVNGFDVPRMKSTTLYDLDLIIIGNSKMLVYQGKVYYQIKERGIRVDAIDIVKQVKIKFKTVEISSHVNMTVKPSEFVAFVGGSGAGKSTFMKAISGVNKPTSGTVLLNGENLYENYDRLKYDIGYVPQDDIVYSNLTLYDMLSYSAKIRMADGTTKKDRDARIKEVLRIVGLSNFENSYIRQLSGGQRKRASIAVELIADPSLFFLDEPTSGLDPGTERSIMQTLREMSEMGKTIILVTHNTLNLHLCDKVAFFGSGGRLCFFGPPQDALKFFGVNDFVDIYNIINEDVKMWQNKYENSEYAPDMSKVEVVQNSNKVVNKKKSFVKQVWNLTARNIKLIFNDIQQLLLLVLQAPLISLLLAMITTDDIYTMYDDTKAIIFSIGCSAIWLGLLNSIQEICKEKVILQKEHMADLKLSAYIVAKVIVQSIIAFLQATILVFVFQKIVGQSEYSILINQFWDMQIICFLSIISAAALGLFISAIVKNANNAMSICPLLLVPQLLFSGMLFKLEGFTKFISNFILCRWTVEGLGTTTNLNGLTRLVQTFNPLIQVEAEDYFTFTKAHMVNVIGVIVIMTVVLIVATYITLRKNVDKNM